MSELEVRVVRLDPMTVAVAHGFGEHPEAESWANIMEFANENDLLNDLDRRRVFGFNNPDPSPGSPNYGYDSWLTVGPEVEASGTIQVHEFAGGLYGVTRCDGVGIVGEVWRSLVAWREDSPYHQGHHQWLEEVLNPGDFVAPDGSPSPDDAWDDVRLDLYLPITK